MANRLYIGARYIPLPFNNPDGSYNWLPGVAYEGMTIVIYDHRSFISKKPVPAISTPPSEDTEHWVDAYLYNADVAEALLSIDELQETKADKDGIYPSLWVGELIGKDRQTDNAPYLFRNTGGDLKRIAPLAYPTLVGATVNVNQLVQNGNFEDGLTGWTAINAISSVSDGKAILTATSTNIYFYQTISNKITDRKVLVKFNAKASRNTALDVFWGNQLKGSIAISTNESEITFVGMVGGGNNNFNIGTGTEAGDILTFSEIMLIDLTALFGSAIADYLYSLEQTTAGAGIAKLRGWGFLTSEYIPYNVGTLESVEATAKVVRDENGENTVTYLLGSDVLRGIFKLDANNNLYAHGDVKTSDGVITRKYRIVDLGTLDWNAHISSAFTLFYAKIDGLVSRNGANGICTKYPLLIGDYNWQSLNDKQAILYVGAGETRFGVRDSAYTDAATFKAAMSGVMLVYPLATPTTERSTPFTSPQICYPDGTEEFVTENGVPVGHDTEYPYDLVGLVENLINIPDVPSTNGTYKLQAVRTSSGVTYNWVTD